MTTVDGINSNGLYNISPAITNGNNRYAVSYTGGLQNDVYEGSNNKKTKEVFGRLLALTTLAAGGLWLWKGKGWDKIMKFFGRADKNVQKEIKNSKKANDTIKRNQNKVSQEVTHEQAMQKVNDAINGKPYVKKTEPDVVVRNIETQNLNSTSRKIAEQAKHNDTVIEEDISAYSRSIAYRAPKKNQVQAMEKINKEAAEESAKAHQIGNLANNGNGINVRTAKTSHPNIKKGVFVSKNGYELTYAEGRLTKIITPDGKVITKPKTLYNYEQKVDMSELKAIKKSKSSDVRSVA